MTQSAQAVFVVNFVKIWLFCWQYEQWDHMLRNDDTQIDYVMYVHLTQCCVSSSYRHGLHQRGGETEGGADVGVPHRRVQTGCSQHSCKYQHTAVTSSLWHHHCDTPVTQTCVSVFRFNLSSSQSVSCVLWCDASAGCVSNIQVCYWGSERNLGPFACLTR